jgi:arylsulfatase A-like enzyme
MKRVLVVVMAVVALCAAAQVDRPKLVVGIIVDQMRWDYLYTYDWEAGGGFNTLMHDGYLCNNTIIDYVPTVTAAGHATVFSGTTPAIHGIVGNSFSINDKTVSSVQDDTEHAVGGTEKTRAKSPRNFITTNIADQLYLATDYKSRTVGVALKDRAAILPSGHTPVGAYWFDGYSKSFITSTYYMDKLPKWVADFNKKNRDVLAGDINNTPAGTTITFAIAEEALINEKLGQGDVTDMLTISVSNTDMSAHNTGSHSPKVDSIYWQLDKELAHFIRLLDQLVGRGNYLLFLTADHGGTHGCPRMEANHLPNGAWENGKAREAANEELKARFGVEKLIKKDHGFTFYLNHEAIDSAGLDIHEVAKAACKALEKADEVEWAVEVADIDNCPMPSIIKERIKLGYYPGRSGDIYVINRTGVQLGKTEWAGSNHGSWSQSDSHIPLIFMGWHITPGETSRLTHMTDIAATVCALLHIQAPNGCIGTPILEY